MKRIIAKQTHYKSLLNTCKRHPEFAEGKEQLQGMIDELEARECRISAIISDIFRPVSFFYAVKQQAELEMNQEMLRFTSMGELMAVHRQDDTMHFIMKSYQAQLYKVSAYRLYVNAISVADILEKVETNFTDADFHSRQLPEFRKQAEDFGAKLTTLADQLMRRKALKKELAALIASTNLLLRDQLDHAVNFFREDYPDFYREYMIVRQPRKRKRRTTAKTQTETKETSFTLHSVNPSLAAIPEHATQPALKPLIVEKPTENKILHAMTENIFPEKADQSMEKEMPAGYLEQVLELIYPEKIRNEIKRGGI